MKKLLVLAVLILVGAASWAQQSTIGTGQWLHDGWTSYQNAHNGQTIPWPAMVNEQGYVAFVLAAAEVMYAADWLALANTTPGQWFAVVGNYLDAHPELWTASGDVLVYHALYAAWPGPVAAPY